MREIVIQVKTKKDEALVLSLAKRLKWPVKKKSKRENGSAAIKWMEELAKIGGIKIENPVSWQRSIRKDRVL